MLRNVLTRSHEEVLHAQHQSRWTMVARVVRTDVGRNGGSPSAKSSRRRYFPFCLCSLCPLRSRSRLVHRPSVRHQNQILTCTITPPSCRLIANICRRLPLLPESSGMLITQVSFLQGKSNSCSTGCTILRPSNLNWTLVLALIG